MTENIIHPGQLNISDYDYPLTGGRIAQYPLEIRDRSRILICRNRNISEDIFINLPEYLPSGSLAIFNESRVIHARLIFRKASGSCIEIFCLEPIDPYKDHQQAFQQKEWSTWECMVGNSKRWKSGLLEMEVSEGRQKFSLRAERLTRTEGGTSQVRFSWSPAELTFSEILERTGKIPLPPYINRDPVSNDKITYQTVYANHDGSVAAPTAGLHFSPTVLDSFTTKGIDLLKLTLHVGAGTFRPVATEQIKGHLMHEEKIHVTVESLEHLRSSLNKTLVVVGTTTTRLLESIYWFGCKIITGRAGEPVLDVRQWDPYDFPDARGISREQALDAVISLCRSKNAGTLTGKTGLMIAPGYIFRFPDILITNFHQPKSTLLLLIAAFIGDDWRKAYQYALDNGFRFLSYGDSCLFFKPGK